MTLDRLLALPPRIIEHRYEVRDTILYALGVGAGQAGDADLPFVYEEGLVALPTMAVILAYPGFWQKEPEYGINWPQVFHVGQSVLFHAPLPVAGTVRGEMRIDRIIDRGAGKGSLLDVSRRIFSSDGTPLATVTQTSLLRGDGGWSDQVIPVPKPVSLVPDRPPDFMATAAVRNEQAMLYRLSGDWNPLHVDPAVARAAGLGRPIVHGLCTYGMAGRALLSALCGNRPELLRRLDCRFTAPVMPGDDLRVAIWRLAPGRAAFRVMTGAQDIVVLDHGYAEYDA